MGTLVAPKLGATAETGNNDVNAAVIVEVCERGATMGLVARGLQTRFQRNIAKPPVAEIHESAVGLAVIEQSLHIARV
ncbi:hypothetical protein, partial [Enterococcus casseliflavus]|uniref:hypothetical protein n=1 Tax=Enterococcus casseliflavus TaxID=37734 RepID=UPI003D0E03CB